LAASGVYLVLYWLPSLSSGGAGFSKSWAARVTRRVSSDLAGFFSAHTGVFAIGLAVLVTVGLVVAAIDWRLRQREPQHSESVYPG
jgi:hypothetical protein